METICRFVVSSICAAVFALAGATVLAVSTTTKPVDSSMQQMIDDLAHPDPAVRRSAQEQLTQKGVEARPALLRASRQNDPRISPIASDLLLKLPWTGPNDSKEVQKILADYGSKEETERQMVVIRLWSLMAIADNANGADRSLPRVLLRLFQEDPSDSVGWKMFDLQRNQPDDSFAKLLRDPTLVAGDQTARIPLLAAAGFATLPVDWDRGLALLRRAVDEDQSNSTGGSNQMEFAFDLLVGDAVLHHQLSQAIAYLRIKDSRNVESGNSNSALFDVIAFHVDFGPFDGFDKDLSDNADQLGDPAMMYALSRIYASADQPLAAIGIQQAALCGSLESIDAHLEVTEQLAAHDWAGPAERELRSALIWSRGIDPALRAVYELNIEGHLGQMAVDRDDDAHAATHFQAAQAIIDKFDRAATGQPAGLDFKSMILHHQLRDARQKGDKEAAQKLLVAMQGLPEVDSDAASEAVDYLRSIGREQEAKALFDRDYASVVNNKEWNTSTRLNNQAWISARCNENLEQATQFATQACFMDPERAGDWDTLAECYFRSGNPAKAIELEKRALSMKPRDQFMTRQLARFASGAKSEAR